MFDSAILIFNILKIFRMMLEAAVQHKGCQMSFLQPKLETNTKINELFQKFHLGLKQVLASF